MTSGRSARACRSASALFEATPTTVTPSRCRRRLAALRKAGLSSTRSLIGISPLAGSVFGDTPGGVRAL
jgi:hypothetical protein